MAVRRSKRFRQLGDEPLYCEADPAEVLCKGSDDENYASPSDRKWRYEVAAIRFLDGKAPHLLSSRLRGPFDRDSGWKNPWRSKSVEGTTRYRATSSRVAQRGLSQAVSRTAHLPQQLSHIDESFIGQSKPRHDRNCHLPSPESLGSVQHPHLDDDELAHVENWRARVEPKEPRVDEFWAPAPEYESNRKRRAQGSAWLKRVTSKRRRTLAETDLPGLASIQDQEQDNSPSKWRHSPLRMQNHDTGDDELSVDITHNLRSPESKQVTPRKSPSRQGPRGSPRGISNEEVSDDELSRPSNSAEKPHTWRAASHRSQISDHAQRLADRSNSSERFKRGQEIASSIKNLDAAVSDSKLPPASIARRGEELLHRARQSSLVGIPSDGENDHVPRGLPSASLYGDEVSDFTSLGSGDEVLPRTSDEQSSNQDAMVQQFGNAKMHSYHPCDSASESDIAEPAPETTNSRGEDAAPAAVSTRELPVDYSDSVAHPPMYGTKTSPVIEDCGEDETMVDIQGTLDTATEAHHLDDDASHLSVNSALPPDVVQRSDEEENAFRSLEETMSMNDAPSLECTISRQDAMEEIHDATPEANIAAISPTRHGRSPSPAEHTEVPTAASTPYSCSSSGQSHDMQCRVEEQIFSESFQFDDDQDAGETEGSIENVVDADAVSVSQQSPWTDDAVPDIPDSSIKLPSAMPEAASTEQSPIHDADAMVFSQERSPCLGPSQQSPWSSETRIPDLAKVVPEPHGDTSEAAGIPPEHQSPWTRSFEQMRSAAHQALHAAGIGFDLLRSPHSVNQINNPDTARTEDLVWGTEVPNQDHHNAPSTLRRTPLGSSGDNVPTQADATVDATNQDDSTQIRSAPSFNLRPFSDFSPHTPGQERVQPRSLKSVERRLPSTPGILLTGAANPRNNTSRPTPKRVTWAGLPYDNPESPTEGLDTPNVAAPVRMLRSSSPPPEQALADLPTCENDQFKGHFCAVQQKAKGHRHRILPSASQQVLESPAPMAMAEAFMAADGVSRPSKNPESGSTAGENREQARMADAHDEDDGLDDIDTVLDHLDDFIDAVDLDADIEQARNAM